MRLTYRHSGALALLATLASTSILRADEVPAPGTTRIAPWKDDKKSAFLIMLDDSIPSDFQNALPELQKRGMTATYYINPGSPHYGRAKDKWEKELPAIPGVVYGNHTMTHLGLKDFDSADADLAQVNDIIEKAFPGKVPRLISFAKPGVGKDKWTITDDDYKKVLAKNDLVARETAGLNAAQFNDLKTSEGMLAIVDKGIETGTVRSILFHGIGGDWLVTPTEVFTAFLDGLVARQDKLWITDHISAHKYETEFKTAKVSAMESTSKKIQLELKDEAGELYDYPLTLITDVPTAWKKVQVTQGTSKTTLALIGGKLQFEAVPNAGQITLEPAA